MCIAINGKKAKELINKEIFKFPNNPHYILQLGIAKLIMNEMGIDEIKSSIQKELQIQNAKSAIHKLNHIPKPSPEILEAIRILQKYCNEISN